jgi:hypothetical protein
MKGYTLGIVFLLCCAVFPVHRVSPWSFKLKLVIRGFQVGQKVQAQHQKRSQHPWTMNNSGHIRATTVLQLRGGGKQRRGAVSEQGHQGLGLLEGIEVDEKNLSAGSECKVDEDTTPQKLTRKRATVQPRKVKNQKGEEKGILCYICRRSGSTMSQRPITIFCRSPVQGLNASSAEWKSIGSRNGTESDVVQKEMFGEHGDVVQKQMLGKLGEHGSPNDASPHYVANNHSADGADGAHIVGSDSSKVARALGAPNDEETCGILVCRQVFLLEALVHLLVHLLFLLKQALARALH